mgnify:CR=1 FL=1
MTDLHPEGTFDAVIADCGLNLSPKSRIPQVVVIFKTDCGFLWGHFVLSPNAARFSIERLRNAGFRGSDLADLNKQGALVGNRCQVQVRHDQYNGQTRATVVRIFAERPAPQITKDPAAASQSRRYNALLAQVPVIGQPGMPSGARPAPARTTTSTAVADDAFETTDGPRF